MGVALGLRELHGIHTLAGIPVKEGRPLIHGDELRSLMNHMTNANCSTHTWLKVRWKSSCTAVELERHVAACRYHQCFRLCKRNESGPSLALCQREVPISVKQRRYQVSILSIRSQSSCRLLLFPLKYTYSTNWLLFFR